MPVPTDLNLPALVGLLQDAAAHLQTAAQFQAGWRAARPPLWGCNTARSGRAIAQPVGCRSRLGNPTGSGSRRGGESHTPRVRQCGVGPHRPGRSNLGLERVSAVIVQVT